MIMLNVDILTKSRPKTSADLWFLLILDRMIPQSPLEDAP